VTPRFVFLPEAQAELQEAGAWYAERAPGLELEFSRAVDAAMAAIGRYPEAFPVVEGDMRRAVLRRFPYQLIYFRDQGRIVVVSCWHHRRKPKGWRSRR
jgi:plasmid stabilization system protein ParE